MQSDLLIPRLSDILDRACELLDIAYRLQDGATARQLERVIRTLPEARLRWELGALIIASPSGHTYRVTRAGCDCPNGIKSHARACWHVATFELLCDMFQTACDTADMAADASAAAALTSLQPLAPSLSLRDRLCAARRGYVPAL